MSKYVSEYWHALVDELLAEGYAIEDAEAVADEECGYRGRYKNER